MIYTEMNEKGPRRNSDPGGDNQQSESWSRQFAGAAGCRIEVDFFLTQVDVAEADTVTLTQMTSYITGSGWANRLFEEIGHGGHLTDDDAYRACARFDTRTLTWDGRPFDTVPGDYAAPAAAGIRHER